MDKPYIVSYTAVNIACSPYNVNIFSDYLEFEYDDIALVFASSPANAVEKCKSACKLKFVYSITETALCKMPTSTKGKCKYAWKLPSKIIPSTKSTNWVKVLRTCLKFTLNTNASILSLDSMGNIRAGLCKAGYLDKYNVLGMHRVALKTSSKGEELLAQVMAVV